MPSTTFPTLIVFLKAGGLIVGILLACALALFAAAVIEQANIGRDIDDAGGGK